MTCTECRETFSAYADEALAADARAVVEQHMAGCAECRRDWQRFSATVDLLHAVQRERAPAGFVDRVLTAARPLPWYRRLAHALLVPWTVKLPLEAAAIVMVAGLAVLVFHRLPEQEYRSLAPQAPPQVPSDTKARFMEQQERLAKSLDRGDRAADLRLSQRPSEPPASHPADSGVQAYSDARTQNQAPRGQDARDPGAKPDAERFEAAPGSIAQQPSKEPVMARRPPLPDQAAAPPPAMKSLPAAPNVAAAGESLDETRAKRQDKPAKEAERDAPGARTSAARERKVEGLGYSQGMIARSVASNVELRLATTDREAAAKEIATIVERLGGAMITPAPGTLEIMVPNQVFAALTGDLSRLGTLRIVQQPAELPDNIRITLRLTD